MSVGIFVGVYVHTHVYICVCVCTSTCMHTYLSCLRAYWLGDMCVCVHMGGCLCVQQQHRAYQRVCACIAECESTHMGTCVCVLFLILFPFKEYCKRWLLITAEQHQRQLVVQIMTNKHQRTCNVYLCFLWCIDTLTPHTVHRHTMGRRCWQSNHCSSPPPPTIQTPPTPLPHTPVHPLLSNASRTHTVAP